MRNSRLHLTAWAVAIFGLIQALTTDTAVAGGFSLFVESGAAAVGNAQAGSAALAEDATTVFFNPAGLTRLQHRQLSFVANGIRSSAKFSNSGSTSAISTIPLTGGDGGDAGSLVFVPGAFYAMDVVPRLKFGMGINAPFGLKTEYDDGWVGRYHALKSELETISITPALALKVNDVVSLGVGFIAERARAELTKAIDFGTVCFGSVFGPATCTAAGILPQTKDGKVKVEGDDWGFGFSLGALFQVTPSTRVGLAYRSKISHEISGDATFTKPILPGPFAHLTSTPATTNTSAKASVTLPDVLSISAVTQISPKWSLLGDVTWTNWSRFKELRVRFGNGAPDSVTTENWHDTVRLAAAVNYQASEVWKLRAGVAYDPTPVKDEFRTPRIPDENRVWLALGTNVEVSLASSVDFAYAHLFFNDPSIKNTEAWAGTLRGTYNDSVDIVTAQFNYRF